MKRQNIKVEVPYSINWAGGVPLEQIKQDIEALENMGVSEINIEIGGYYNDSIVHTAYRKRIETLAEVRTRLEEEKYKREKIKEHDLALFEKLKKQFSKD